MGYVSLFAQRSLILAVEYLRAWKSDRSSWKFQKVRQTWLLSNLYDEVKVRRGDSVMKIGEGQQLKC